MGKYDLAAVAVGGVLGAAARHLVVESAASDGGWFVYAPNSSVTLGTNVSGFEPARSSAVIESAGGIPADTLVVNLIGCLLLGMCAFLLVRSTVMPRRVLIAAATGFCGSLTTFSTFAVELAAMLRARPMLPDGVSDASIVFERATPTAIAYVALSLVGGALTFWLGRVLARTATKRALL